MLRIVDIARLAHEVNRAFCAALGDTSHRPWDEAPEWQRDSVVQGVWFHIENPEAGPEASHENWMRERRAAGWKYGPFKNPEMKEHPSMVPFAKLPLLEQAKDYIFRAVVSNCLAMLLKETERVLLKPKEGNCSPPQAYVVHPAALEGLTPEELAGVGSNRIVVMDGVPPGPLITELDTTLIGPGSCLGFVTPLPTFKLPDPPDPDGSREYVERVESEFIQRRDPYFDEQLKDSGGC